MKLEIQRELARWENHIRGRLAQVPRDFAELAGDDSEEAEEQRAALQAEREKLTLQAARLQAFDAGDEWICVECAVAEGRNEVMKAVASTSDNVDIMRCPKCRSELEVKI